MTFVRSILRLVPAVAIVAVGCGGGGQRSPGGLSFRTEVASDEALAGGEEPVAEDADAFVELVHLDVSLREELSTLDCEAARDLTATVCELAERVCSLGDASESSRARCSDGRQRCERAQARVAERCPR